MRDIDTGISRRRLLTVASASAVALGQSSAAGRAPRDTETILQESFEGSPERTRPSDWTKSGTGVAMVIDPDGDNSVTGTKIFGMFGNDDACSSVAVTHALDLAGRRSALFKAYVFPTDRGQDGCTPTRAGLSLHTDGSESVSLLALETDGTVRGPGDEPLGEYVEAAWNELVVAYERSGDTVELSYTINGDSRGTISKPRHPEEQRLTNLRLEAGVDIVWWDALEVTASAKTATATASQAEGAANGDTGGGGGEASGGNQIAEAGGSDSDAPVSGFGAVVGAALAVAIGIFTMLAALASDASSGRSDTRSSERVTEDEVEDGLKEAEKSLRRDRRR